MRLVDHKKIDSVIHARSRLAIMSFLYGAKQSDFVELKRELELSDGNLGAQLRRLEKEKYVSLKKGYQGRKTHMTVLLTKHGEHAMHTYLETMREVLKP